VEAFLAALRAQGSSLEVRRFKADVNVRVARSKQGETGKPPSPSRKAAH
jgi:hypothetical protein